MKLAITIICYTMAFLMFLGCAGLAAEGTLDFVTLLSFVLVEAQSILTLIYISDKK